MSAFDQSGGRKERRIVVFGRLQNVFGDVSMGALFRERENIRAVCAKNAWIPAIVRNFQNVFAGFLHGFGVDGNIAKCRFRKEMRRIDGGDEMSVAMFGPKREGAVRQGHRHDSVSCGEELGAIAFRAVGGDDARIDEGVKLKEGEGLGGCLFQAAVRI